MFYTSPQSNKTTKPLSHATIMELAKETFQKRYTNQKGSFHIETYKNRLHIIG